MTFCQGLLFSFLVTSIIMLLLFIVSSMKMAKAEDETIAFQYAIDLALDGEDDVDALKLKIKQLEFSNAKLVKLLEECEKRPRVSK